MPHRPSATVSVDELPGLLAAGPHSTLAFVGGKATVRALAETLAALANSDGGLVILGVDERGSVQRNQDPAALQDTLTRACVLVDPPLVLPVAQPLQFDGSPLVAVEAPPGLPNVYNVQGVFLTRTGARNRPLTTPELRRLLLERGEASIEGQTVDGAHFEDLVRARVDRYLDRLLLAPDEDPVATLIGRGCMARDGQGIPRPTIAGLLLFGANPQRWLPGAEIVCVRFPGESMGDEFVRQDLTGPIPEQIRQAEAFVASNLRRGMRIQGLAREEVPEYPAAVVREAIVNAVAHRDYAIRGEGIRLLLFANRLEIYSPGRLPGHVTLDNLQEERYSRNPTIVTVLGDLGYVERLGYGIDRMIAALRAAGQPDPHFEETAAGFQVTLQSALVAAVPHTAHIAAAGDLLNERQRQALDFVQANGRIANSDLQALAPDVSGETIRRDLADLVERNLLIRIGSKRATYYILK